MFNLINNPMKKNLLYVLAFALIAVVSSCKKEEDPKFNKEPYASTTDAQNKAAIEQAGEDALAKLEDLKDTEEMEAVSSLMLKMDVDPISDGYKSSMVMKPFVSMANFKAGKINSSKLTYSMANLKTSAEFEADWAEVEGTWDWTGYGWTRETNPGKVVINFPKDSLDTENSATLEIIKPTFYEGYVSDPSTEEMLPESFSASLSIDGTEVITFDFTGTYSDAPSVDVEATLNVAGFELYGSVEANTSRVAALQTFTYEPEGLTIYSVGYEMTGNFSEENVANVQEDLEENGNVSAIGRVFSFVKAHVQIFNIKLAADIDIAGGANAAQNIINKYEDEEIETEEEYEAFINDILGAINGNVFLRILYADTNTMIAYAEAYYDREIEEPSVQFVFGDGSKIDADVYMEENFADMVADLEDFINEIEEDFALDIDDDYEYGK